MNRSTYSRNHSRGGRGVDEGWGPLRSPSGQLPHRSYVGAGVKWMNGRGRLRRPHSVVTYTLRCYCRGEGCVDEGQGRLRRPRFGDISRPHPDGRRKRPLPTHPTPAPTERQRLSEISYKSLLKALAPPSRPSSIKKYRVRHKYGD